MLTSAPKPPSTCSTSPKQIVVGIADFQVSDDPQVTLATFALGSCIGLAIWDSEAKVGGMLHYMLPESSLSPDKAKLIPAMFADTGIPTLFRATYELGAVKSNLIVKVAGGAHLLGDQGSFNIGKRNYVILRKILWKAGVLISSEGVGGSISRTLQMEIGTGRTTIRSGQQEVEL